MNTTYLWLLVPSLVFLGCGDTGGDQPPPPPAVEDGVLYNVAGIAGEPGSGGDGGPAGEAHLSSPMDGGITHEGNIYIVDAGNNCVRSIDQNGTITKKIGSGLTGNVTSGPAENITLDNPTNLILDSLSGNMLVAATGNQQIVMVDPSNMAFSVVGTTEGFSGDGGPANQAQLAMPNSVIFDGIDTQGIMYICDQLNQRIRKVATDGTITTLAGSTKGYMDGPGAQAQFSFPDGPNPPIGGKISWAHHPDGLLIADTDNNRIRYIILGTDEVFTIAGTGVAGYSGDGGRARDAQLNHPTDVYLTDDHNIFIADAGNNVIRKIDAVGYIYTVAGTGEAGFSPDETPAEQARLNNPTAVFFHEFTQTLYIVDTGNHQVKRVHYRR